LLRFYRRLSMHAALPERDRLQYADAYRRRLLAGRSRSEHAMLVASHLRDIPPGSDLALLLMAEQIVLDATPEAQESIKDRLLRLLPETESYERRRAVLLRAIDFAVHDDYEQLPYQMGKLWVAAVPSGHPERKHAAAVLGNIVLERAYVELADGRLDSAAGLFDEVIRQNHSLEAHEGYLEAKLRAGESWQTLLAAYTGRFADQPQAPELAFVRAYLRGQRLAELTDIGQHRAEVEEDMNILAPALIAMPRSPEGHHLYGYLAHREFHHSGDKRMAMLAHNRYYLALDLSPRNVRRKAALLHELGLLQAALGNHHLALLHFDERERLPFLNPGSELAFRLADARSQYHRGHYTEAAANIENALALVSRHDALSGYRTLVLDRAAFYHYVGRRYDKAIEDYTALMPAIAGESLVERLKASVGLGASALALERYPEAIEALTHARRLLESDEPMRRSEPAGAVAIRLTKADYWPIVAGLLAQAHRGNGDHEAALTNFEQRRHSLRALWRARDLETYLQEAAAASHHMAYSAIQLGRVPDAVKHLKEGLADAATYRKRSGADVDDATLSLLEASLDLHLLGGVPLTSFSFDLPDTIHQTFLALNRNPNPRWRKQHNLFASYLTVIDLDRL
jgi:cellulose synthase operon protein C